MSKPMKYKNLFGEEIEITKRSTPLPSGHAAKPGTGPEGESCATCLHLTRIKYAKSYLKCGKMRSQWTSGPGTDVRAKDPACHYWESKDAGCKRGTEPTSNPEPLKP